MKISCIVPVYNVERYLRKCVNSLLNQTYKDIEIVLINDVSIDKSGEICQQFADKYPDKIKYINKIKNEGVDCARFDAIRYILATNPKGALTFVDADDWLEKDSLARLAKNMEETSADVVQMMSYHVYSFFKTDRNFIAKPGVYTGNRLKNLYQSFFGVSLLGHEIWGKLYRVELIQKANLSPSGHRFAQDVAFNLYLFPHIKVYSLIEYRGYNYRYGGRTSKYSPEFWEIIKKQYDMKRYIANQLSLQSHYETATIEVRNVFFSIIEQRIYLLKESQDNTLKWIESELENRNIWDSVISLKDDTNNYTSMLRNRDVRAIYDYCNGNVRSTRFRRTLVKFVKRFL